MRRTLFVLVVLCGCASVAAAQVKVSVCHRDGQGRYRTISVAPSAVAAHVANHGDCVLGLAYAGDLCVYDRCDEVSGCARRACDTPPSPCEGVGGCVPDTGRCFFPQLAAGEPCYPDPPDDTCDHYTCDSDAVCTKRCIPPPSEASDLESADMCMLNQSVRPASSPARASGPKRR